MKTEVAPALLAAADPYKPSTRPPGALHDASLYRGRYYLYFGVAPVLTLLLPFRLVTGVDLPLPAAVMVFALAGFAVSGITLVIIRRRYFPGVSRAWLVLGLLALAIASLNLVIVRRGNIWELPLSSGLFFAALALLMVYCSLHSRSRPWLCLGSAALFVGLAVASRLSYLYASGLLLVPLWVLWCREGLTGESAAVRLRRAAVSLLPLVVIGLALAWYNYLRFDNPLEFGVSYQLSGVDESIARHFSPRYVGYNIRLYFFRAAGWYRYFPFIHPTEIPNSPAGHIGSENVYGIVRNAPFVLFAFLAPLALWRRSGDEKTRLGAWLATAGAAICGTAITLCFFYAAMARYFADFVPALVLIACVGVLSLVRWSAHIEGSRVRVVVAALTVVLTLQAIFFGWMYGFELYGDFRRRSERDYAVTARLFDTPARVWDAVTPGTFGPIEFDVRLAPSAKGRREPLLSTGWWDAFDEVFVQDEDDEEIRIGFRHSGGGEKLSRAIRVDRGIAHRVSIELGSLYPPEDAGGYAGWSRASMLRLTRRLRVEWDGEVVLDEYQRFHTSTPGRVRIGESVPAAGTTNRFRGSIAGVHRRAGWRALANEVPDATEPSVFDAIEMKVVFSTQPAGVHEPLVASGEPGAADFLFIEHLGGSRARLGLDHWGSSGVWSEPFDLPTETPVVIVVSLDSFPSTLRQNEGRTSRRNSVRVNGTFVWSFSAKLFQADAEDIHAASNPIGGTACGPDFKGRVLGIRRLVMPTATATP